METAWRLKTILEYSAARLLFSSLALLPRPVAFSLSRAIARIVYLLAWKLRRIGELNLKIAFPKMNPPERRRLLRDSFVNLGRHLGEFSCFSTTTPETLRKTIDCEGLEKLEAARALGRGVIMITGHLEPGK